MIRKKDTNEPYVGKRQDSPLVPEPYEKGSLTNIAGKAFSLMSVASLAAPLVFLMPQVAAPLTLGYLFAAAGGGIGFGLAGSWLNHKYRQTVEGDSYNRISSGSYRSSYSGAYNDGGSGFWNGYMIGSIFNGRSGGSYSGGRSSSSNKDAGKAMAAVLLVVAAAAAFYCSGKSVYDNFIKRGPVAPDDGLGSRSGDELDDILSRKENEPRIAMNGPEL